MNLFTYSDVWVALKFLMALSTATLDSLGNVSGVQKVVPRPHNVQSQKIQSVSHQLQDYDLFAALHWLVLPRAILSMASCYTGLTDEGVQTLCCTNTVNGLIRHMQEYI